MTNMYGTGDAMSPSAHGERSSIWWLAIVRGIFAIIFGILVLVWPVETVVILTLVFAVYAIVDGIVNIVAAIATRKEDSTWGWLLTQGILTLIVGVLALFAPLFAAQFVVLFVLWVIAIWAVIGGIFGIPAAATLGASGGSKAAGIILAVLAIILGIILIWLLVTNPESALSGFVWLVGVYAIVSGVVLIIAAIAGRAMRRNADAIA
jgi:uncharacterized membrane protein HdeD (DUF308 family)